MRQMRTFNALVIAGAICVFSFAPARAQTYGCSTAPAEQHCAAFADKSVQYMDDWDSYAFYAGVQMGVSGPMEIRW